MRTILMRSNRSLANCAAVLLLTACASYTVSTAQDFIDAANDLNKIVADSDAARVNASNAYKESLISAPNSDCRVSSASTYVRKLNQGRKFIAGKSGVENVLKQAAGGNLSSQCIALKKCEEAPNTSACISTCYSDDESSCITQLSLLATNPNVTWDKTDLYSVNVLLSDVRYPETIAARTLAEQETLALFGEYLDLLKAAATPQPTAANKLLNAAGEDLQSSLTTDFTDLAKKVSNAKIKYNSAAQYLHGLPTVGGVTSDQLQKETSALGALASNLNEIVQQSKEAKAIGPVVKAHQKDVHDAIIALGDDIANDVRDAYAKQSIENQKMRDAYQNRFNTSSDMIAREDILIKLKSYPAADQNGLAKARAHDNLIKAVKVAVDAHDALVELVVDPKASDRREQLKAAFSTLKQLIQDTAAVVAIYK